MVGSPIRKCIGGYLKKYDFVDACLIWWDKLTVDNKKTIMNTPNFDSEVFKEITGINLEIKDDNRKEEKKMEEIKILENEDNITLTSGTYILKNCRNMILKGDVIIAKLINTEVVTMYENSQVYEMYDNSKVLKMYDYSQVGGMHDDSHIGYMYENSKVGAMWDDSEVVIMRDNSHVEIMHGNSEVGYMYQNSKVGAMRDNSIVGSMFNDSRVLQMHHNSKVEIMRGNSKVEDMCENSKVEEMYQNSKIINDCKKVAKILNFKDIDFEDVKSMDKDCMVEVLKILGCNLGEEFSVVEENGVEIEESPFMFVKLLNGKTTFIGCSCASQGDVLIEILNGTYKIIKNGTSDV